MKRAEQVILLAGLLGTIVLSGLAYEQVGAIFEFGSSARGLGLGGAFSALVDDEGAVAYNPAALGEYEGIAITSMFVRQFGGVTYGTVGVALPYFGINVLFLDSGFIPVGESGFRYVNQGVIASVGIPVGPLGIGVRWRLLRVSSPMEGHGWALDPAFIVATGTVRAALVVEGAFSDAVSYESGSEESWPTAVRLGVALTLSPSPEVSWNASFEAIDLFMSSARLALGLEAWIGGLGARVGYDGEGPTFGLSTRFERLRFDWAYAMRTDLGDSHRVSFTLRF